MTSDMEFINKLGNNTYDLKVNKYNRVEVKCNILIPSNKFKAEEKAPNVYEIYEENYKILRRALEEGLAKWRHTLFSWMDAAVL